MSDAGGEGTVSANSGQSGGVQATLFTQDQVNHFAAEAKRGARDGYFKELGLEGAPSVEDMKGIFDKATEFDKLQQGQQTDLERLSGELGEVSKRAEQVPVLELALQRAQIAADAGLKPRYWKYVEGKTDEEIAESVRVTLADVGGGGSGEGGEASPVPEQPRRLGTGTLEPNPQQGSATGKAPVKTLAAGAEAYKAKHKKE
jgi:hypothetical protein